MYKVFKIVFLTLCCAKLSHAQTIQDIFKSMPIEYTVSLTASAKDSLLQHGTYILPGGDSIETMQVDYSYEKDYIRLEYYYTTGQTGYLVIELRQFQKHDGSIIVVYSKYGGVRWVFDQHSILVFDYVNGTFKINDNLKQPEIVELDGFLEESCPDSLEVERVILNSRYDLNPEEVNSIEYVIFSEENSLEKWIKADRLVLTWDGERFQKTYKKSDD